MGEQSRNANRSTLVLAAGQRAVEAADADHVRPSA
jgi:hypothetical protein